MTKSELFKAAHAQAKATVKVIGSYQIAFKLALIALYAEKNTSAAIELFSADLLDELKFTAMDTPCFEHIFIDESQSYGIKDFAFRAYGHDGFIVLQNGDAHEYSRSSRKTGNQTWNGDDVVTDEIATNYTLGKKIGKIEVPASGALEDISFSVIEQVYEILGE